jgi:hypothetical protein
MPLPYQARWMRWWSCVAVVGVTLLGASWSWSGSLILLVLSCAVSGLVLVCGLCADRSMGWPAVLRRSAFCGTAVVGTLGLVHTLPALGLSLPVLGALSCPPLIGVYRRQAERWAQGTSGDALTDTWYATEVALKEASSAAEILAVVRSREQILNALTDRDPLWWRGLTHPCGPRGHGEEGT